MIIGLLVSTEVRYLYPAPKNKSLGAAAIVLDKQKRFQLSSELAETVR